MDKDLPGVVQDNVESAEPENKSMLTRLKEHKILALSALVIAILLVVCGVYYFTPGGPAEAGGITITALQQDSLGTNTGTAFLIKCEKPISQKTVKEYLKITPPFEYSLESGAGGQEFTIIPDVKLAANKVYSIAFDPSGKGREELSWAFQTKSNFAVISSMPGDETGQVPVNTGIEFNFTHDNLDMSKIKDYFSIVPHVDGRFEKHKRTVVFVPQRLNPGTVYTVVLKKGLPLVDSSESISEDYQIKFETQPLAKDEVKPFQFQLDDRFTQFATKQAPYFTVYFDKSKPAPAVHIDLYGYKDRNTYQKALAKMDKIPYWCSYARSRYREDVKGLQKLAGYDTKFINDNQDTYYIALPTPLKAGYYLAQIGTGNNTQQVWFQSTDLSVYVTQNEGGTLFWANDLVTKKPAQAMKVVIASRKFERTADKNGVLLVKENLLGAEPDYALITSGNKEVLAPLASDYLDENPAKNYWRYLYIDRELYLPGDTVNYWGVLSPKKPGVDKIKDVTVELLTCNYGYNDDSAPIVKRRIEVKGNTFTGKCKLPLLKPDVYRLEVKAGDTQLLSRMFEVATYKKPSYKITIESDKRAVYAGEKVNFKVNASFFEGTPVPDLPISYDCTAGNINGGNSLDAKGQATVQWTAQQNASDTSSMSLESFDVTAGSPEVGNVSASAPVLVFPSKVCLTSEVYSKANNFTVKIRASNIDISKATIDNYSYNKEEYITGPAANKVIAGKLIKQDYTVTETGEHYNFVSKQVEKTYQYNYFDKQVGQFGLSTGADGTAAYNVSVDPKYDYYVDFSVKDDAGREYRSREYINSSLNYVSYSDYVTYALSEQGQNKHYTVGETVNLTFTENGNEIKANTGGFLFFKGQTSVESYAVSGSPHYSFKFGEWDPPNVCVYGVFFDGQTYLETGETTVFFAEESKALNVKINTDKKEYRPGDKVNLTVQVTDKDGKPVEDASVNLNLVDEALYNIADQRIDLLGDLYEDFYSMNLNSWRSHYNKEFMGAEQGGDGGSERQDFRDTVLFTSLETDSDGQASTEFKLPDNLTSWRLTYHAINSDILAGSGTSLIPVRLPFFVEMTNNSTYLAGDSPVIILRGYGTKIAAGQPISYTMRLIDARGKAVVRNAKGMPFSPIDWTLPRLSKGQYKLTVTGKCQGFSDTLTKPITVASSFLERTTEKPMLLKDGLTLPGSPVEPTNLIFSDYEKNQYIEGLYRLSWLYGGRIEHRLAQLEARKLLTQYFPSEKLHTHEQDDESLLDYQQQDGGISILPYADSDLALSALIAANAPDYFDKRALKGYFENVLEDDKIQDKSLTLLGLASLHEPVLLKIQEAQKADNLAPAVRINLALALLEIGDGSGANKVFRELLGEVGQDLGSSMRIKVGRDQDDYIAATTQMAVLAAHLNQPEKNKLYQYLLDNPGQDIVNSLEQLEILKCGLRYMNPQPVSFAYQLNGEQVSKTLDAGETFSMTVSPQNLKNLKFSQVRGKVGVLAQYVLPFADDMQGIDQDLKISRRYFTAKTQGTSFSRSDIVWVELTCSIGNRAPGGDYEVEDILPAGLVYVQKEPSSSEDDTGSKILWYNYPCEVDGQRISLIMNKNNYHVRYATRVISPGEFTAEAPLLSHMQASRIYTRGVKQKVIIR